MGPTEVELGYENFKQVYTHSARRSATTDMVQAWVPDSVGMAITGHQSQKQYPGA